MSRNYPLCDARGVLVYTDGGPRVDYNRLFPALSPAEQSAWYAQSRCIPTDEYGLNAEAIERFFRELPALQLRLIKDKWTAPSDAVLRDLDLPACIPFPATEQSMANLSPIPMESMMNKAMTAPRKRSTKKAAKKASLDGAAGDKTKNDPAQPPLPGMEEERIPAIERCIKKVLDKRKEAKAAREEAATELERLPGLLHKHNRQQYKCLGRMAVIEPGADIVRIKKVKDK